MEQRLLGIWKYDDDIGYLCGEIEEFLKDGRIKVAGFQGMAFEPIKIIPYDPKYKTSLNDFREELAEGKKQLVLKYRQQFEELVGITK